MSLIKEQDEALSLENSLSDVSYDYRYMTYTT